MLQIHTLPLGQLQANCYLVHGDSSATCVVIDPGDQPQQVLALAAQLGKRIEAVLLTHGHFDHVGAVQPIVKATGCALWMHEDDYTVASTPTNDFLYPLHDARIPGITFCEDGEEIRAGGLTFTVIHTPGHSQGSVCFRCEKSLFTGDTLFAGGCGRTDLPGGSWDTIIRSLREIARMDASLAAYPGHGESTTLAREKLYNPYMK